MSDLVKVDDCLYFRFSTSTFIVRKSIDGRVFDRSTGIKGTVEKKLNGDYVGKQGFAKAKLKRDKIVHALTGGDIEPVKKKRATFEEYFKSRLTIQKSKNPNTYSASKAPIELRLMPWFKTNCPLIANFKIETWAQYCMDQREAALNAPERVDKDGKKLGGKKVTKFGHDRKELTAVLSQAFRDGVLKKHITRADLFLNDGVDFEGRSLTKDERVRLVENFKQSPDYLRLQVGIGLLMGMRVGEILKIRREAINLKNGELYLESSTVKTKRGRYVVIHDALMDLFSYFVKECEKNNGIYIFPKNLGNKYGSKLDYSKHMTTNKKSYKTLLKRAQIEDFRFHDLRGTYMSLAALFGISALDTAKQVGASVKVIEKVYHRTLEESKAKIKSIAIDEVGKIEGDEK